MHEGTPVGRRVFLGMLGLGAAGVLWGSRAADVVDKVLRPTALFPGASGFRIYSVVGFSPKRTEAEYRLRITGLVDRELDLTLADLRALPATQTVKDFQCVTGWRVPDVPWVGVRLRDLLEQAGIRPEATAVRFHSFDGVYAESLTLDQARRDDVLVAYEMLGVPITRDHGGPVRLYVAPMYGYKSLKWLDEVVLTAEVEEGYWERRGYDVDAWIGRSNGRDDQPVT
ncbi:MAG: molybdopterin-dependent oxidoreductase [Actinomycetota bacterium]|nr:molybdopterin-dependent oxidoreductase [Actinomycetota bacterium]